jgi:hypothetical protein
MATHWEGLSTHLDNNAKKYNDFTKKKKAFLSSVGAIDLHEEHDVRKDVASLNEQAKDAGDAAPSAAESDKASLYGKPGADVAPGDLAGLSSAGGAASWGGSIGEAAEEIDGDTVLAFDPETGEQIMRTDEDMYKDIIDFIVEQRCFTEVAQGAFKALLWGAAVLDLMTVQEMEWPEMIDETRAIWEGHVAAIAQAREEYLENGKPSTTPGHMPIIVFKPQDQLGATATWSGGTISVGDQYASLSGTAKIAVLFHEDEHHWDSMTKGGIHDNHYTGMLAEPDDTPSGKNWTETLAYRNMGDFVNVLSLDFPRVKTATIADQVPSSL